MNCLGTSWPVRADGVTGRKDLELTQAVLALDQLRSNGKLMCEDRIAGDQLLGQLQVVAGPPSARLGFRTL
jgi:hypothetical protein